MCIPMAIQVASMAISAYGAYKQSAAQKSAMQAEAAATDRERAASGERADLQAQHIGEEVSTARGRQLNAMASGGVDLGSASSQAALARTDYYGLLDQSTAAKNAADQDFNYRDRSRQLRSGASQIKPWMAAGSSLLSSAGKVASSWYGYSGGAQ